jgi:hypothetical protein
MLSKHIQVHEPLIYVDFSKENTRFMILDMFIQLY